MKKTILLAASIVVLVIILIFAALGGKLLFFSKPSPANNVPVKDQTKESGPIEVSYIGWLEHYNPILGVKFLYPALFRDIQAGTFTSKLQKGDKSGARICTNVNGCIPNNSAVFEINATSSFGWVDSKEKFSFLDLQGYELTSDGYIIKLISQDQVLVPLEFGEEIPLNSGGSALVILGMEGPQSDQVYPLPGKIGAIINTPLLDYPAIVSQMQLSSTLNSEIFKAIIKSIHFPYKDNFPPDRQLIKDPIPPRFYDPELKKTMDQVIKVLHCRYLISGRYPEMYYPDHQCGHSKVIINSVTQKPFYYQSTSNGQGFILKALLSTGEIYTLTESTNPPPTLTPPRLRFR